MNILKENGVYSLTRILAAAGFAAFIVVSFYLAYTGKAFQYYDTFASLTGGGGAATQIANKLINSKFNTSQGEAGKPMGSEIK